MIITRTPHRISFLGGGTDFPTHYEKHGGICVGAAINRYGYITARCLPPFHNYRSRFAYSQLECCHHNSAVMHKGIRATLKYLGLADPDSPGLELFHACDLPGRSGTGSSSTFIVGLLNALSSLQGRLLTPKELTYKAIDIERNWLQETVGCQDQTWASYGGLNTINFGKDGTISVYPIALDNEHIQELNSHLLLFFTKIERISSDVAKTYVPELEQKSVQQLAMMHIANEGLSAIHAANWKHLGDLVDASWRIKARLSEAVTNERIDNIYSAARLSGAWGGKITGAGGGGCIFLVAPPQKQTEIIKSLEGLGCVHVPFGFDFDGSRVIFSSGEKL